MVVTILAAILTIQTPQPADIPVTIEEYLKLRRLSSVRASPDGASVAFTVTEADLDADAYSTRLYVWDADDGAQIAAPGYADVREPRWSHDGGRLAFLSAGRGSDAGASDVRIWSLDRASGALVQLGDLPGSVIEFDWAPGDSLYALVAEGDEREFWRINARDGGSEYVWGGDPGIRDMAVSPDGRWIAFATNGSGSVNEYLNYDIHLLDLQAVRSRELTSRPGSETAPRWSPDSRTVVFQAPLNPRYPYSQRELFSVSVGGGALTNLTASFDRSVMYHTWPAGADLLFTAAVGSYTQMFAAHANGAVMQIASGDFVIGSFDAAPGGTAIYAVRESPTQAAELWRLGAPGSQRLTDLNGRTRRWTLGRQEVIHWTAPDGQAVEGLLVYPAGYVEGRRYPLLVNPAGGPLSRVRNAIDQPALYQLFAARGYAVLAPNFRGSSGYGNDFATAKRADLAGGDLVDLLAGVDRVIEMGIAAPERLAIYGGAAGAYAAFMTRWAITQTQRFNAAVAILGPTTPSGLELPMLNPFPEYALFDAGYMDLLERERSPLESIANVHTPLLIVAADAGSLISRSQRIYRALSDLGRSVEMVELAHAWADSLTPRERTHLFFRELRWFDKYLKFGGADLFDFFLVGEWVPGPAGWQMRVVHAEARPDIAGLKPAAGRYLEIELSIRPDETAAREGEVQSLELDPAESASLVAADGVAHPPAGTVTDIFGRETLLTGAPGAVLIPVSEGGTPTALTLTLAFEVPDSAGAYRLRLLGFVPVRIWVPGSD